MTATRMRRLAVVLGAAVRGQAIERDVSEGRGQVNFSRWGQYNPFDRADMLDKVCELAASHKMPPLPYRLLHSAARLSETEVAGLCVWSRGRPRASCKGGS